MLKFVFLAALGFGLAVVSAGEAAAQTPTVEVNKPFKVIATHDGQLTTHYVLTIDPPGTAPNVIHALPVSALAEGEVTFDVGAQKVLGAYTAVICARNVDPADATNYGESCSSVQGFSVAKPVMPPPPTKPTIRLSGTLTIAGRRPQKAVFEVDAIALVGAEAEQALRLGGIR